jgi:hypothetical protein
MAPAWQIFRSLDYIGNFDQLFDQFLKYYDFDHQPKKKLIIFAGLSTGVIYA